MDAVCTCRIRHMPSGSHPQPYPLFFFIHHEITSSTTMKLLQLTKMPFIGTTATFIVLLTISFTLAASSGSSHYAASAFLSSSSFATRIKPPSIHQHVHIMMGKRQQQHRQNKGNKRNNKKKQSLESLLELETDLNERGFKYVIGSDVSDS